MSIVPQKLATQYKSFLLDVDTKRPGEGLAQCGHLQTRGGVKNWQNLTDIFNGWPLNPNIDNKISTNFVGQQNKQYKWNSYFFSIGKCNRCLHSKEPFILSQSYIHLLLDQSNFFLTITLEII